MLCAMETNENLDVLYQFVVQCSEICSIASLFSFPGCAFDFNNFSEVLWLDEDLV